MNSQPKHIKDVLFLDVETVSRFSSYQEMPLHWKELWDKKASHLIEGDETAESIFDRSGIYAEFGKIICISVAFVQKVDGVNNLRVKSFYGEEKQLLTDFAVLLEKNFYGDRHFLCAHNGKEFDFPYLGRRFLANRIPLPNLLQLAGKKPWEVRHLDTMQLWKFGDYKSYTSLELMAAVFEIPTPKDDMDGSKVFYVYYHDSDIERIVRYCQKDVVTLANLYLRINNHPEIEAKNVVVVE